MLSGLLSSDIAVNMNPVRTGRSFVEIHQIVLQQSDLKIQLQEIKERLGNHNAQLNPIYDTMENLLNEKAAQRKWDDWERIEFGNR